jgi:hypothetical protein
MATSILTWPPASAHGEYTYIYMHMYIYICMLEHFCGWIGPKLEFCRFNSTSVETRTLPAQNQGSQNGRSQIDLTISYCPPSPAHLPHPPCPPVGPGPWAWSPYGLTKENRTIYGLISAYENTYKTIHHQNSLPLI